MKKLTAVVVGYGSRGSIYSRHAVLHPDELEIVAIAEPTPARRETARSRHNLPDDRMYTSWEELAAQPKMADFAIIGTQDNMHYAPALALIEKGYHLLLEKPMAPTPQECKAITEAAEKKGVKVVVCHVLRFSPFWRTIKRLIDEGRLGKIMSVIAMENVGHHHQSHSFVRGNWRNTAESTCMIMAKCCHDMDIFQWLLGQKCKQVQSFGRLSYFTRANQPAGAPDRCTDGCPVADTCHYNAIKLYPESDSDWFPYVAANTLEKPTYEQVYNAIKTGPYGRCVFACDNDVVDHQVVNLEYEDGCTLSFTMSAFNKGGRSIRIFGTEGELISSRDQKSLELYSFQTEQWETIPVTVAGNDITSGHGGGDRGIMEDVLCLLRGETPSNSICDVRTSYENHITGFAAEESRLRNQVISIEEYEKSI